MTKNIFVSSNVEIRIRGMVVYAEHEEIFAQDTRKNERSGRQGAKRVPSCGYHFKIRILALRLSVFAVKNSQ